MRIIVLHGNDQFQLTARTQDVADALREIHGEIEQFTFEGETAEAADVLDELRSYGLIQQHKLVILDDADVFLAVKDEKEENRNRKLLESYAQSPVDSATFLMRATTWRSGKIDKLIQKCGQIYKIEPPNEVTAARWCISRIEKRYDGTIEPMAATRLVELIGPELGRLDVELAKLAAFVADGEPVSLAHVAEMVGMSREEKVWSLQAAIATGDPSRALGKLRELMQVSDPPLELVTWAICDMLRKIHSAAHLLRERVPPGSIIGQLKLFGDGGQAMLAIARRCNPADFAPLFQAAIQMDLNNKRGVGQSQRSLEAMAVQIADTITSASRR